MSDDYILVDQSRPTGWRGWIYRRAVNAVAGLARVVMFWKPEGVENIPREGGTLIVANHPSYLEPPSLVCMTIYFADRDVSIMAWDKLFKVPVVRFFTKTYKAYPVDRDRPGRGPYQTLIHILKQGGMAGVFPEGSRSKQRLMGDWKPGALRAAFNAKATILPVSFVTVGEFWPRSRLFPRLFRRHHIVVHKPLTYEDYMAGKPDAMRDKDYQEEVSRRIRAIINEPIIERMEEQERVSEERIRAADPMRRAESDPIELRRKRYARARERLRQRA